MSRRARREPITRDAAASVDAALLTLRRDPGPLLALWLVAWAPQATAAWFLVDAVVARDEPLIAPLAWALVLAMPWRWGGMALLQARVMVRRGVPVRSGLAAAQALLRVARTRAVAAGLAQLTSPLLLPPLWFIYGSAFAGPMALAAGDRPGAPPGLGAGVTTAYTHTRRVARHALLLSLLTLVFAGAVALCFLFGLYLLQALVNVELATEVLVWSTPVCLLTLGLVAWAAWDLLLNLSAVFLLERLENRRDGGDLQRRLEEAVAAAAPSGETLERAA